MYPFLRFVFGNVNPKTLDPTIHFLIQSLDCPSIWPTLLDGGYIATTDQFWNASGLYICSGLAFRSARLGSSPATGSCPYMGPRFGLQRRTMAALGVPSSKNSTQLNLSLNWVLTLFRVLEDSEILRRVDYKGLVFTCYSSVQTRGSGSRSITSRLLYWGGRNRLIVGISYVNNSSNWSFHFVPRDYCLVSIIPQ